MTPDERVPVTLVGTFRTPMIHQCPQCPDKFPALLLLVRHMIVAHGQ